MISPSVEDRCPKSTVVHTPHQPYCGTISCGSWHDREKLLRGLPAQGQCLADILYRESTIIPSSVVLFTALTNSGHVCYMRSRSASRTGGRADHNARQSYFQLASVCTYLSSEQVQAPYEARKHASEAPAGPQPMIKNSVSTSPSGLTPVRAGMLGVSISIVEVGAPALLPHP